MRLKEADESIQALMPEDPNEKQQVFDESVYKAYAFRVSGGVLRWHDWVTMTDMEQAACIRAGEILKAEAAAASSYGSESPEQLRTLIQTGYSRNEAVSTILRRYANMTTEEEPGEPEAE